MSTAKVIRVRKDETATTECPCCGRNLKWIFTTDDGFVGGSGCVAKHCGLKVAPRDYSALGNLQSRGATLADSVVDHGDLFELWNTPKGVPVAVSRNGMLQCQGLGDFTANEWARIKRYAGV